MDLGLNGKKALVTGSTSGIGYAIAEEFISEGVEVVLNGRTQKNIDSAISKLENKYPNAKINGLVADFLKVDEVKNLIDSLGDIDILINNVGIYTSQNFEETTDEDWLKMFEVNIMSGVRLSRHFLPKMMQKNWGRIIFVSSECAMLVPEDLIAYSTTKSAMLGLSRGLAQLTKGTEVTVNTVLPGSTLSEGAKNFLKEAAVKEGKTEAEIADGFFKNVRTSSLIQRFISPKEIANTTVYLCSPLAAATNGASIKLDGGSVPGII